MTTDIVEFEEQWRSFVQNAIWGLEEAGALLKDGPRRQKLELRSDWFRRGKSRIPRENSVSRALADAFNYVRARQNLSSNGVSEHDLRHIAIECEVPRPVDPGISDKAKPTDIRLLSTLTEHLDLRIEAKVVADEAELRKGYLGKNGIERFDDGDNPYTIYPYGGMAAYVLDADRVAWTSTVTATVEKKYNSVSPPFTDKKGVERHMSIHNVTYKDGSDMTSTSIKVFHLVFEIEANPSLRPGQGQTEVAELNASVSAVKVQGARLPDAVQAYSDVEAPAKS